MNDLKDDLLDLDRLPMRETWIDISRRTPTPERLVDERALGGRPGGRRLAAGIVALVVFATAGVLLFQAFNPSGSPIARSTATASFLLQASERRNAPTHLYFVPSGEGPRRLSLDGGAPSLSPDGEEVLATRTVSESVSQLAIASIGTGKERTVTGFDNPQESAWSPTGSWIAFTTQHGSIYRIHPDGTGLTRVTKPPPSCGDGPPGWSPDASSIVFGRTCDRGADTGLYVIGADGTSMQRLSDQPSIGRPGWSPSGGPIAFTTWGTDHRPSIYLINSDGTGLRLLTTDAGSPSWSPGGDAIAIVRSGAVKILDSSGNPTAMTLSTPGLIVSTVVWSLAAAPNELPDGLSQVEVVLPIPPECRAGIPTSDHLKLATENGSHMALIQDCAYAPANKRFTITFTNQIVTIDGKDGPPQNLSIYRSQEDAISITPSGDEFAIDRKKAIFVGDEVAAPGTIKYEIQPLPPGTYYVQSDFTADRLVATLIVE
jgi:hypothetical protein